LREFNGAFPEKYEDVISLKGVGKYTAAAICSIAYGKKHAVMDGNVQRLISRLKGIKSPVNSTLILNKIEKHVLDLMSSNSPGVFNESIMEFGALVCKPKRPLCDICILNKRCYAFQNNMVFQLPVKRNKLKVKTRYFYYNVIYTSKGVLINKREEKDIWKGLYEFPLIEADNMNLTYKELKKRLEKTTHLMLKHEGDGRWYEQKLTHQKVLTKFNYWRVDEPLFGANKMYNFVRTIDLNKKAFPKTIIWFLDENIINLNSFYN
jgi:A/G-specific adenine glycosylase